MIMLLIEIPIGTQTIPITGVQLTHHARQIMIMIGTSLILKLMVEIPDIVHILSKALLTICLGPAIHYSHLLILNTGSVSRFDVLAYSERIPRRNTPYDHIHPSSVRQMNIRDDHRPVTNTNSRRNVYDDVNMHHFYDNRAITSSNDHNDGHVAYNNNWALHAPNRNEPRNNYHYDQGNTISENQINHSGAFRYINGYNRCLQQNNPNTNNMKTVDHKFKRPLSINMLMSKLNITILSIGRILI